MTLADAIGRILSSIDEPLGISEIIAQINSDYLGEPIENTPVDEKTVRNCIEANNEAFNFQSGIVTLQDQPHPVDEFEKEIYKVLDIMRGYFKMDVAAMMILPQVFIFRIHQLARENHLPKRLKKLELHNMGLNNITDLCDIMNKINSSEIEELSGSLGLFINEFETIIGEEMFEVMFKRLKNNNYSSAHLKEKEFGKLYSSLIKNIFGDSTYRGEYLTSKLTKKIFSNIKLTPGEYKILDPAFGIGGSIIEFIRNQRDGVNIQVHGYEVQQETYNYAVMNLICNGIYSFDLKNKDCFENEWKNKFDLILSDPPVNLKNGSSSFEVKLANKTRKNLNDDGRACFLVSNKILYGKGKRYRERKQWIHQNLLKKVISLPQGVGKEDTNIAVSILYFENRKGSNDFLEFYSFNFTDDQPIHDFAAYADKLFSPIEIDGSYYQKTKYDEVIEKDYNLLAKRYVGQIHKQVERLKENSRANKLKNYLKRFNGQTPSDNELKELSDKVIKIQDLKEDPFEAEISFLNYNSKYESITNNDQYKLIDRDILLIARSGEKLKPTYIKTKGHSFLIDSSILAFKITGEIIHDYLFYQLHSSFFRKQLESIQRGSTIPYTPSKDLLNLYIKLPLQNEYDYQIAQKNFLDNKKQEAFEEAYREKKAEAEKLKKKIDTAKYKDQTFRDIEEEELIEYMNHNVRNKLSPVKGSIELIYDFMHENEGSKIDLNAFEGELLEGEKKVRFKYY